MSFDPNNLPFNLRYERQTPLRHYLETVATNEEMLTYLKKSQYGGKHGQSLYAHILNGVMLLEILRELFGLSDLDAQLLFTTFTIHDINKDSKYDHIRSYNKLAVPENFEPYIERVGLAHFFPEYKQHLDDLTAIARGHSRHKGMLTIAADQTTDHDHFLRLRALIRAVDIIDLSHDLDERTHKSSFLEELNQHVDDTQYDFYLHRITENRGTLTNVIHNACVEALVERGAIPLLFYPDGVAYLVERGHEITVNAAVRRTIAEKIDNALNEMVGRDFATFIKSGIQGIKVDEKCLELGIAFPKIWARVDELVQKRSLNPSETRAKIIDRTEREFAKNAEKWPDVTVIVRAKLDNPEQLTPLEKTRLRTAELIRTYYIFLQKHFKDEIPDGWTYIYDLLTIPDSERKWLTYFDALWDRPYVFINLVSQTYNEILTLIEEDGSNLLTKHDKQGSKQVALFEAYLERHALFGNLGQLQPPNKRTFEDYLTQYVTNQHKQCVQCSSTLETSHWMAPDVRSDITVQTFSNRLRGGKGTPKKYICGLCQRQFLLDKLNYEEVREEKTMYLHLTPYSFMPTPLIEAIRNSINSIRGSDEALRTLWIDTGKVMRDKTTLRPRFATRTKANKPHSFGLYLQRSQNTIGNRLIFPLNPAGSNDSQRFLYTLWNGMALQRHFGMRVLISQSPVAPLDPEAALYIDTIALSCQGLIRRNDYPDYEDDNNKDGERPLEQLWETAYALHSIGRKVNTQSKKDEVLAIVQAMARRPIYLFYAVEKLIEARVSSGNAKNSEWATIRLSAEILTDLKTLFKHTGDNMDKLSNHLAKLAEIARASGLKGKSLKKHALIMPIDHIFEKVGQASTVFGDDDDALKAVIKEDIFAYLDRVTDEQYRPGKKKTLAIDNFVETFFTQIIDGLYKGNKTKLLADEKYLRSAYLFYIRKQYYSKKESDDASVATDA